MGERKKKPLLKSLAISFPLFYFLNVRLLWWWDFIGFIVLKCHYFATGWDGEVKMFIL